MSNRIVTERAVNAIVGQKRNGMGLFVSEPTKHSNASDAQDKFLNGMREDLPTYRWQPCRRR